MNSVKIFTFLLCFVSFFAVSKASQASDITKTSLKIAVHKIKLLSGHIHYQLLQCPDDDEKAQISWDNLTVLHAGYLPVTSNELSIEVNAHLHSRAIVRVFQDLNQNQQLDFSDNQVPKEPFGISNNPSLMQGEPMPNESCFTVDAESIVDIRLNNKRKRRKRH